MRSRPDQPRTASTGRSSCASVSSSSASYGPPRFAFLLEELHRVEVHRRHGSARTLRDSRRDRGAGALRWRHDRRAGDAPDRCRAAAASPRGAAEERGPRRGAGRGAPDRRRLRPRHRDAGRTRDPVRLGQADHRRPRGVAARVRPRPPGRADRREPGRLRERQRPLEPVDRGRRPEVRRSGPRAVALHRGVLGGRRAAAVVRRCGALPPAPDPRDRVRHRQGLRRPGGAPRRSAERADRAIPGRSGPDRSVPRGRDPAVAEQSVADHRLPRQRLAAAGRAGVPRPAWGPWPPSPPWGSTRRSTRSRSGRSENGSRSPWPTCSSWNGSATCR